MIKREWRGQNSILFTCTDKTGCKFGKKPSWVSDGAGSGRLVVQTSPTAEMHRWHVGRAPEKVWKVHKWRSLDTNRAAIITIIQSASSRAKATAATPTAALLQFLVAHNSHSLCGYCCCCCQRRRHLVCLCQAPDNVVALGRQAANSIQGSDEWITLAAAAA